MIYLFFLFLITFTLVGLVYCLGALMSWSAYSPLRYKSAFECGYLSYGPSRLPFSLQFFLISIIFVIFDLELIIMMPYIMNWSSFFQQELVGYMSLFVIFMVSTTIYEWSQKNLEWEN